MKSSNRIYCVSNIDTNEQVLVRASNAAQALRHVSQNVFTVRVASQNDLIDIVSAGGKVEEMQESAE